MAELYLEQVQVSPPLPRLLVLLEHDSSAFAGGFSKAGAKTRRPTIVRDVANLEPKKNREHD